MRNWLNSPTNMLNKGLAAFGVILFALALSTGLAYAEHLDAPDSTGSEASESVPSASQSLFTEPHDLTPSESEASVEETDELSEPSAADNPSEPSVSEPSDSDESEPSESESSESESSD